MSNTSVATQENIGDILKIEIKDHSIITEEPNLSPEILEAINNNKILYNDLLSLKMEIPLPPNQVSGLIASMVDKAVKSATAAVNPPPRSSGKVNYEDGVRLYSLALDMACRRPLWEAASYSMNEISDILLGRARAYAAMLDWPSAIVDCDACIEIRKGYIPAWEKKVSYLHKWGKNEEAWDTLQLALQLDPKNKDLNSLQADLKRDLGY